jgi:hypothetical protein
MGKAVVVIRKRDQKRYWCTYTPEVWPGHAHLGDCYLLRPCGFGGRTHYKTIGKFLAEYEVEFKDEKKGGV